jgi:excisionase family DNA binding protein
MEVTKNSQKDKRISIESFAKRVGVSYQTIYRYIKKGQLVPRRTLGGKTYFLLTDVDLFKGHTSSEPLILNGESTDGTKQ